MARPGIAANLNIAQLEQMLSERKAALSRLEKQRAAIQKRLVGVDRQIAKLGGVAAALGRGARVRNEKSLSETLEDVLRESGRPMKVGEIADAVAATGYRSKSDNFRAIVNQTLIKERKRFVPSGQRGMYQIKKA